MWSILTVFILDVFNECFIKLVFNLQKHWPYKNKLLNNITAKFNQIKKTANSAY